MLLEERLYPDKTANLTYRPARLDEAAQVVDLINAYLEVMVGAPEWELEELVADWTLPGFDIEKSTMLAVAPDGALAGVAMVWDVVEPPVSPGVDGAVHPDFMRQGIGTRLMNWAETRARQAISRVPADVQVVMRSWTASDYQPAARLFEQQGMSIVRRFQDMMIELDHDIPAPNWPEGMELKTYAQVPDLLKLYRAVDEAFKDHYGHVDRSEEDGLARFKHWIENDPNFDPNLWFLAMDGAEIAAVSLCRASRPEDPDKGFVNTLGVRRPWRRKGVALALLHHSFHRLAELGRKRVGLGVDATSLTGANKLYIKAGMHVHKRFDSYQKVLRPGKDISRQALSE